MITAVKYELEPPSYEDVKLFLKHVKDVNMIKTQEGGLIIKILIFDMEHCLIYDCLSYNQNEYIQWSNLFKPSCNF
jgi:hypothetical protein